MSNEVILERKNPHFISTGIHAEDLKKTTDILKALAFTALGSIVYLILSKKQKENKKNKEALAYEVW